jgi:seryl-tRNA synthetase
MLDIKFIRENKTGLKKSVKEKQFDSSVVDKALKLDEKRRSLILKIEDLRKKRNEIAKQGKRVEIGREIKDLLKKLEPELKLIEEEFKLAMCQIPNPAASDVKVGKDESENKIIKKWGKPTKFTFKAKDHLELGESLDIIDVKRASKVSGSRFGYLKGDAARLEFALIDFVFTTLTKEGFAPVIPPVLIKKDMMAGMGYFEHGGQKDMYVLDKDKMVLVGTSEQSIGPMHSGEVLNGKDLPLRYMGFSTCFRREAGSYGKDTRGIFRVHQFDKVEMFSFTLPENSDKEHEYLLSLEEKILKALKIPYRVSKMCTGDLGGPTSRKYDIEAWLPGQGKYREVTSTSTTTDFQSRRLKIKYQEGGKTNFVHMLNGTAVAIGRTIIAIMENYQNKDGSIEIPAVLQKHMGKKKISINV